MLDPLFERHYTTALQKYESDHTQTEVEQHPVDISSYTVNPFAQKEN